MSGEPIKILLVEDNPGDARLLREAMAEVGSAKFELNHVDRLSEAVRRLGEERFDVILLDLSLPDGKGINTVVRVREQALGVPIIVLTGLDDEALALDAVRAGAQDYLIKGQVDGSLLARAMRYAIERNQAEMKIERNLERVRVLREIDQAITSTLDLGAVLRLLLEKIDLVLPYSATTVRLFNKGSGLLEPVACRNLDEEEWKAEQWRAGRGVPNVVFETRAPVRISNVQTDPRNKDLKFFRKHGLVSYLGVPLIVQDEVLGVLSFYTKEEHEFSNDEIEFLSTLAGQAAVAIHNSQLYEEIASLAAGLARSNKVKDEFLSVMSHELRTPLTSVLGYVGMMQDKLLGEINPKQERALEMVLQQSNDLLAMINSILQSTHLEAEAVKVEREEVNLLHFFDELRSAYGAVDKRLTLTWDYGPDLPVISTDGGRLKQILQNLINNAIKFTEHGHVAISARYFPEREGVQFRVADTGIGIPKESLTDIFEMFRQVDSSETRNHGGVGLGLYIVKRFTELLGGKVDVESEPGKGSIFTVTIPLQN